MIFTSRVSALYALNIPILDENNRKPNFRTWIKTSNLKVD